MPTIKEIVARLEEAHYAYHNGLPETMTDDQYDELKDQLEALDPAHPFLTKVGAPIAAGDEVALPIPLPSLNKAKPGELGKWLAKNPAETYMVSAKLDGCSALWLPATRSLFTRGDGTKGRNISAFAPFFKGLPAGGPEAIRGELIMRTDSTAVPEGKLARNIVAGVLNRKEVDPTLFAEIHFVAYELIEPATMVPMESNRLLKAAGFETARATLVKAADMTEAQLSAIFDAAEKSNPYQMDGIVVAPNVARVARPHGLANPTDRVAWKQRGSVQSRRTTVREVDWNVSASGFLIPRVLFDEVEVGGAKIHAATGLHGRWIHDNAVGPGAIIEIRRAGDTIPQIIAVHSPAPAGPSMPPGFEWVTGAGGTSQTSVHIRPAADSNMTDLRKIRVVHALGELGVEHVGPGVVAKLFAAGFNSVGTIYAATPADFAARVEGCKGKMASKIFDGLRAAEAKWTELDFLAASSTMPRTVGRTKLGALLLIDPKPARWHTSLPGKTIPGISADTVSQVIAALPAYGTWRAENLAWVTEPTNAPAGPTVAASGRVFVMTGFRDKELEAALAARGDVLGNTVSKKTTAVVYPDGPEPSSSKVTKAQELGVPVLTLTAFRAKYLN